MLGVVFTCYIPASISLGIMTKCSDATVKTLELELSGFYCDLTCQEVMATAALVRFHVGVHVVHSHGGVGPLLCHSCNCSRGGLWQLPLVHGTSKCNILYIILYPMCRHKLWVFILWNIILSSSSRSD